MTWGIESKNIYTALQNPAKKDNAQVSDLAFSSLGGWGKLKATFDHWRNFIACVRTRRSNELIAPLEEAKQSCGLAYLVEAALRHRRRFGFDPAAEVAVEDTEINAYFSDQDLGHGNDLGPNSPLL